jgi:hypothetical protein
MKKLVFLTLLITATLLLTLAFPAAATGPKAPAAPMASPASPAAAATTQEYRRPRSANGLELFLPPTWRAHSGSAWNG